MTSGYCNLAAITGAVRSAKSWPACLDRIPANGRILLANPPCSAEASRATDLETGSSSIKSTVSRGGTNRGLPIRQQITRAQARTIMERKCPVLMDQHEARVRPSLQTYFRSSIRPNSRDLDVVPSVPAGWTCPKDSQLRTFKVLERCRASAYSFEPTG